MLIRLCCGVAYLRMSQKNKMVYIEGKSIKVQIVSQVTLASVSLKWKNENHHKFSCYQGILRTGEGFSWPAEKVDPPRSLGEGGGGHQLPGWNQLHPKTGKKTSKPSLVSQPKCLRSPFQTKFPVQPGFETFITTRHLCGGGPQPGSCWRPPPFLAQPPTNNCWTGGGRRGQAPPDLEFCQDLPGIVETRTAEMILWVV